MIWTVFAYAHSASLNNKLLLLYYLFFKSIVINPYITHY